MPTQDDNAAPAGGVDPATPKAVVLKLTDARGSHWKNLTVWLKEITPELRDLAVFHDPADWPKADDPYTDIGYNLPEDSHPRTRKTSSPKAKTRDHDLHMQTVKEIAALDLGFFMHIDEKAGKVTLRRAGCQTVIYLTHKSRWLLAGRNKTKHGTVAQFAEWYRNNIGVS